MRIARTLLLVVAATAVAAVLSGCPKHDNFPSPLSLTAPPTPENFVITDLGAGTPAGWDYGLEWTVSDPGLVSFYRVYLLNPPFAPELQFETTVTSPPPINFPFQATGIQLAVSAVSNDNVEGAMATGVVP